MKYEGPYFDGMAVNNRGCCVKSKQSSMLVARWSVVPKLPNPNASSINLRIVAKTRI
jgi:hypothetical protein